MKIRKLSMVGIFLLTLSLAFGMGSKSPSSDELRAVVGLIGRLLPEHGDFFRLELIISEDGKDVFELESPGGREEAG